jgi:hypothetical protein
MSTVDDDVQELDDRQENLKINPEENMPWAAKSEWASRWI